MEPLPVTLIVKAPNQQFEDQTIKCEPTWSIRKLKGYLSEVYPCNPTLDEQKLIYSGQLLNDAHILKDVLRQYEGQDTHTVHLVYTPKNRQFPSTTRSVNKDKVDSKQQTRQQPSQPSQQTQQPETTFGSDGLRHRSAIPNANQNATASQVPPFMSGYLNTPQAFMPGLMFAAPNPNQPQPQYTPEQYAVAQQLAMQNMMHQMYLQYMNQYAAAMQQQSSPPQVPFFAGQFPQANFGTPTNAAAADQPQDPAQQDPSAVQVPRFQAAAAAGDDEAENRDWLEILYTLSRLLVLLSLVYFYSSPARCSIVIVAIVLYYFYQNYQRSVRERQQQERLQEGNAEPDVIEEPAENAEQPNESDEDNQQSQGEATPLDTAETENTSSSGDQEENNRLPTVTLLRTFIFSFFSSLIPETPAV